MKAKGAHTGAQKSWCSNGAQMEIAFFVKYSGELAP